MHNNIDSSKNDNNY